MIQQIALPLECLNKDNIWKYLNPSFDLLVDDKIKNKKKIVELCHVAKFLSFFEGEYLIKTMLEEPDFIISSNCENIGLEHTILLDSLSKSKEGVWDTIIKNIEQQIREEKVFKDFLANIYINPVIIKTNEKQEMQQFLYDIIIHYLQSGELINNSIIRKISKMKHSQVSLCPNYGAWMQKRLSSELLIKTIRKKEELIDKYKANTLVKQWLLIVIGGLGVSSFSFESDFDVELTSKFDRIFILEDFEYNLFEVFYK